MFEKGFIKRLRDEIRFLSRNLFSIVLAAADAILRNGDAVLKIDIH